MKDNTDKYSVLKQYFGYDSFRPGQESLIDAILGGRDAFGIMPTGGGKSLCYQIPAMLLPGVTFVISPLISLMQDQVMQLKEVGIPGAYINSSLTLEQLNAVYRNLRDGKYKVVYIAPERLQTDDFIMCAMQIRISLIAVDEAHCISQWGQDFRPSYLEIPRFVNALPRRPVVAAFTATATEKVRDDIADILGLYSPEKVVTSFDRPNLSFDVIRPGNRSKAIAELVRERRGKSGIVYCATRKNVESVCEKLCENGIAATRYHAGLDDGERAKNQEDFLYDVKPVMVATNAFGMGINKSNVNYVIHYNMPKSLEEYYQEAGRAGRDGECAECILMYSASDIITAKMLISNGGTEEMSVSEREELYKKSMDRLETMISYCETTECLRGRILDYFGEKHPESCGNCGNCSGEFELADITTEAQQILSCTERIRRRLGFSLGKTTVTAVLRDAKNENITKYSINEWIGKTLGCMKDKKSREVSELFDYLCVDGYIDIDREYKTARITAKAMCVLRSEDPERVFMPMRKRSAVELMPKKEKKKKALSETLPMEDDDLYEALRTLRSKIAAKEKMPAYIVFTNASLADMVQKKPKNMEEFLEISGVGRSKAEKYGDIFIAAISEHEGTVRNVTGFPLERTDLEDNKKKEPKTAVSSKQEEKMISEGVNDTSSDNFEVLLETARAILSENDHAYTSGAPVRVTVVLTSNGNIYSALSADNSVKLGIPENRMLSEMIKEYDTHVKKLLTMWNGGNVFGTKTELLRRLWELERRNREALVLVAKSTSITYDGEFVKADYNVEQIKYFV